MTGPSTGERPSDGGVGREDNGGTGNGGYVGYSSTHGQPSHPYHNQHNASFSTNKPPVVAMNGSAPPGTNTGPGVGGTSLAVPPANVHERSLARDRSDFQIEEIAPWHVISSFISIYLGYSHSLFPMVHRPSFSQRLAMRDDRRDRDFRALVLGIGEFSLSVVSMGL